MKVFVSLLVLALVLCAETASNFPSYVTQCKRDENLNKCVIDNVYVIKNHFDKAIPKLYLPKFKPYIIPQFDIQTGQLMGSAKNVVLNNLDQFVLNDLKMDLDKNEFFVDVTFDRIDGECDYTLKGKLLLLQLNGGGKAQFFFNKVHAVLKMTGEDMVKGDEHYKSFNDLKLVLEIDGDSHINLEDIIPNNKEISDVTNKVINENIKEIVKDLIPYFADAMSQIVSNILKGVFNNYSLEKLFTYKCGLPGSISSRRMQVMNMNTLIVLVFVAGSCAAIKFPPFVTQCKRDANLNKCLIDNIDVLKKDHFTKPIPKLFLPQFSPFHIPRVDIQTSSLNITCLDLYLSHMDTVVVNELKMDLENVELFVDVLFEKLDGRCDYQMKGKLLVLELNGGGKGEFNLTKVRGLIKLKGDMITKGGEHFISYKQNELSLDMQGDSTVKLENIINNNKELSDATNKIVNENIKDFISEILPSIADTAEQIFLSIMNKLTQTYSIEQLFIQ
ncbi:PREDICTED: uncharacterized protein LOC108559321 [Nicrophorus vespilloides]|uniref:Uncharacterized protein LOC108559321 n=1 Tax=Nicrophorus vespilloides TaxID=110193 RepID=A0ABM1MBV2_NICVS|nr:PREDICTED: uncharacterized protein LOC108559321 [Nicrophorus vespilloides]